MKRINKILLLAILIISLFSMISYADSENPDIDIELVTEQLTENLDKVQELLDNARLILEANKVQYSEEHIFNEIINTIIEGKLNDDEVNIELKHGEDGSELVVVSLLVDEDNALGDNTFTSISIGLVISMDDEIIHEDKVTLDPIKFNKNQSVEEDSDVSIVETQTEKESEKSFPFLIVIIALLSLVVGGVFIVKKRNKLK